MVKRGYRIVAAPLAGLADLPVPIDQSLATTDSEILAIGYLGLEVAYTRTEKQTDAQTDAHIGEESLEPSVQYVPTKAFQQICTEYSQLSTSSSSDSSGSDSISLDGESFDTAWSEILEQDSVFNIYSSAESEGLANAVEIDTGDEFGEALETPFVNTDHENFGSKPDKMQVADIIDGSDEVNIECKRRLMKARTMNDLNNEYHYARKQNAESLNSVLENIVENDLEGRDSYHENKDNNVLCDNYYTNKTGGEYHGNSNTREYRKRTNSIDLILDMQKYVIQKKNVYNENYNNIKWHVKCFECKTTNVDSQLDLPTTFSENVPHYPLDDFYKKRHTITSKKNRRIANLILCGCVKGKTRGQKKHRTLSQHEKPVDGRLAALGFRWKK